MFQNLSYILQQHGGYTVTSLSELFQKHGISIAEGRAYDAKVV